MIALVIGGTGTLGKNVLPLLLANPQVERVRILSRGEHTQMEMADALSEKDKAKVDFFVGDVRDAARVKEASKDCEVVFHFAAMKSVDKAEYDPWEAVQTNIQGTKNVIDASKSNGVRRGMFTSTDKAVAPLNIYGASKLVAEKLYIQANIGKSASRFSVCRYGNVFGSSGSVVKRWSSSIASGNRISLTHEEMTRFFILPHDAAKFVYECAEEMKGGEVFIPKMKSTTIINLARAFMKVHEKPFDLSDAKWIGIRPGEKMHEVLISPDETTLTTDITYKYIRWPNENLFPIQKRGEPMTKGFTSFDAKRFTDDELEELIKWELASLQKSDPAGMVRSNTEKKPLNVLPKQEHKPSNSSSSQIGFPM